MLFLFCTFSKAQITKDSLEYAELGNYNNNKEIISPSFTSIGIITVSTSLLFLIDKNIKQEVEDNSLFANQVLNIGHKYGEYKYNLGLSGLLYLTGFISDESVLSETGKILFESLIVSGLISTSIKFVLGRSRPYKNDGNYQFNWFEKDNKFNSLPAGHVVGAFATSTVLSKKINNDYVSFLLFGLAGLTAFQRIQSGNHWFSDTFLGASIGYLTGSYFSNLNKKNKRENESNYSLLPFFSSNRAGLFLNIQL